MRTLIALMLSTVGLLADVEIAWDPSTPSGSITNYIVSFGTNAQTSTFTAVNVGTNLSHRLTIAPGRWYVVVQSQSQQGIKSDYSLPLAVDVPSVPVIRLRLQGAGSITGPWTNIVSIDVPIGTNAFAAYRGALEVNR